MALTDSDKISALFKGAFGVAETSKGKEFYEEIYKANTPLLAENIWYQSDVIPAQAPVLNPGETSGVVKYNEAVLMQSIAGVDNSFYLPELADAIPFNFDDGGSYNFVITDSNDNPIQFGQGDWVWVPGWPVITFYGDVPQNMPPKITFYQYVGFKGLITEETPVFDNIDTLFSYPQEDRDNKVFVIRHFNKYNTGATSGETVQMLYFASTVSYGDIEWQNLENWKLVEKTIEIETVPRTIYINRADDPTNPGSDSNGGTSPSDAFETFERAIDDIGDVVDTYITLRLGPGEFDLPNSILALIDNTKVITAQNGSVFIRGTNEKISDFVPSIISEGVVGTDVDLDSLGVVAGDFLAEDDISLPYVITEKVNSYEVVVPNAKSTTIDDFLEIRRFLTQINRDAYSLPTKNKRNTTPLISQYDQRSKSKIYQISDAHVHISAELNEIISDTSLTYIGVDMHHIGGSMYCIDSSFNIIFSRMVIDGNVEGNIVGNVFIANIVGADPFVGTYWHRLNIPSTSQPKIVISSSLTQTTVAAINYSKAILVSYNSNIVISASTPIFGKNLDYLVYCRTLSDTQVVSGVASNIDNVDKCMLLENTNNITVVLNPAISASDFTNGYGDDRFNISRQIYGLQPDELETQKPAVEVQNITALKNISESFRQYISSVTVVYYDEANEGATTGGVKRPLVYAKQTDYTDTSWQDLANWKQLDAGGGDYVDFAPQAPPPPHKKGRVFYDETKNALSYFNEEQEVIVNLGQEVLIAVRNETGQTIPNGSVVYPSGVAGGKVLISLADASKTDKSRLVGMVTHTIEDQTDGYVTRLGEVSGLDTSMFPQGGILYLDPATPGGLVQSKPDDGSYLVTVGAVKEVDETDGSIVVDPTISELTVEVTDTNGFPPDQRSSTVMDVIDATREFTIAPNVPGGNFHYYVLGNKYEQTETVSLIFADLEGNHWIYFDSEGLKTIHEPTQVQKIDIILKYAFVSYFYWNAVDKEVVFDIFDERHGISMSPQTHLYLHLTRGSQYVEGYAVGDVIADGSGDNPTDAQFSVTPGTFFDEDLGHTSQQFNVGDTLEVAYLEGNNLARISTTNNFALLTTGTGRLAYNLFSGGVWSVAEVSNNDFVLYHLFAINGMNKQLIMVMGQNEYGSLSNARSAASTEIGSIRTTFTAEEGIPVATFILQTSDNYDNIVKARFRSTDDGTDFIDWRTSELAQGAAPSDHQNLTGLEKAATGITWGHIDDQPQTIAGPKTFSDVVILEDNQIVSAPGIGMVRRNGTDMEFHNGTEWKSLTQSAGGDALKAFQELAFNKADPRIKFNSNKTIYSLVVVDQDLVVQVDLTDAKDSFEAFGLFKGNGTNNLNLLANFVNMGLREFDNDLDVVNPIYFVKQGAKFAYMIGIPYTEDTTPPTLQSAVVRKGTETILELKFSEQLNNLGIPDLTDILIEIDSGGGYSSATNSDISLNNDSVNVTFTPALNPGELIRFSYTPNIDTEKRLRDLSDNEVTQISQQSVANQTQTISDVANVAWYHIGESGDDFTLSGTDIQAFLDRTINGNNLTAAGGGFRTYNSADKSIETTAVSGQELNFAANINLGTEHTIVFYEDFDYKNTTTVFMGTNTGVTQYIGEGSSSRFQYASSAGIDYFDKGSLPTGIKKHVIKRNGTSLTWSVNGVNLIHSTDIVGSNGTAVINIKGLGFSNFMNLGKFYGWAVFLRELDDSEIINTVLPEMDGILGI